MPLNYHDILAEVGLRINALTGVQQSTLNTTWATRPLTVTQFQNAVFPLNSVKNAVLLAEEKLATWIAETANHPWRGFLRSVTVTLVDSAFLPKLDGLAGAPIIGAWGTPVDSSDGKPCTEQPLHVIQRRNNNAGGFYTQPRYHFKIRGDQIFHTRPFVKMTCCIYDKSLQKTAMDNNAAILLPDVLEEAYIAGALSNLMRDDEFAEQAVIYRRYFEDTGMSIKGGLVSIPPVAAPMGSIREVDG